MQRILPCNYATPTRRESARARARERESESIHTRTAMAVPRSRHAPTFTPSRPHARPPARTHACTHACTHAYARAQAPRGCARTPQSDRRATCLCIAGNINIAIYARFNCSATLPAFPSRPSAPPRLTGSLNTTANLPTRFNVQVRSPRDGAELSVRLLPTFLPSYLYFAQRFEPAHLHLHGRFHGSSSACAERAPIAVKHARQRVATFFRLWRERRNDESRSTSSTSVDKQTLAPRAIYRWTEASSVPLAIVFYRIVIFTSNKRRLRSGGKHRARFPSFALSIPWKSSNALVRSRISLARRDLNGSSFERFEITSQR